MIKKLFVDTRMRKIHPSKDEKDDEDYDSIKTNREISLIPEEMLLDLKESSSIPDSLLVFQTAFKVIVEQIKKLSENDTIESLKKANSINHKTENHSGSGNINDENVSLEKINIFVSSFSKTFTKMINQMIMAKFEFLSSQPQIDDKKIVSILSYFIENTAAQFVSEFEMTLGVLIGSKKSKEIFMEVQELSKQLYKSITGSEMHMHKKEFEIMKDACVETEGFFKQVLNTMDEKSNSSTDKQEQIYQSNHSRPEEKHLPEFKHVGVLVQDKIAEKKIELLIVANKKLKFDCDEYRTQKKAEILELKDKNTGLKDMISRMQSKFLENESLMEELNDRLENSNNEKKELSTLNKNLTDDNKQIHQENQKLINEIKQLENDNRGLQKNLMLVSDDCQKFKNIVSQMRDNENSNKSKENQLKGEIERVKANYMEIGSKLKTLMAETDIKIKDLEALIQDKDLRLQKEIQHSSDCEQNLRDQALKFDFQIEEREKTIQKLTNDVESLEKDKSSAASQINELFEKISTMESERTTGDLDMENSIKEFYALEIQSIQEKNEQVLLELSNELES